MHKLLQYFFLHSLFGIILGDPQITLIVNPSTLTEGVNTSLTLRCTFKNIETISNTEESSTAQSKNVSQMESIIITINSKDRIARIIPDKQAETYKAAGDAKSTGYITRDFQETQFLEVVWPSAGRNQSGLYRCTIMALDKEGNSKRFVKDEQVLFNQLSNRELLSRLTQLEEQVKLNTLVQTKDISDLKAQLEKLFVLPATTKVPHVEQGFINFGESYSWPVFSARKEKTHLQNFKAPYEQNPVIILTVEEIDFDHKFNSRYRLEQESVTTTGFKIRATLFWDSVINNLMVRWISIGV